MQGTILELMKDQRLADFDLIYAAGLFDYLSARVCRRLMANLFARLRSGGRLLVANFVPGGRDAGYLQAFMDWRLIYRPKDDILDFPSGLVACELGEPAFIEPSRNIGFLEIEKGTSQWRAAGRVMRGRRCGLATPRLAAKGKCFDVAGGRGRNRATPAARPVPTCVVSDYPYRETNRGRSAGRLG